MHRSARLGGGLLTPLGEPVMRKALLVITEEAEQPSSSGYNMNLMVARSHGSECSICWPAGRRRRARRWPNFWASIRHTLGHWLAIYEMRGLDALLNLYVSAGKLLSPAGRAGRH